MVQCPLGLPPSTYSCKFLYPNCTLLSGLEFPTLWYITQCITQCPNDTRIFSLVEPSLTAYAVKEMVGDGFTRYPGDAIWDRLTAWKFPLLQLVALYPRPPLGFWVGLFVLIHHVGNPINTLENLLLKFASCQSRAMYWIDFFDKLEDERGNVGNDAQSLTRRATFHRLALALALIIDSYDEFGYEVGNEVESVLTGQLKKLSRKKRRRLLNQCRKTANRLAADRSTKFLPVVSALCFFIGNILFAIFKTWVAAAGPNPQSFINIESWSIAFSALYFWIIPTTIFASTIGISQTEESMPRTLRDFHRHLRIGLSESISSVAQEARDNRDDTVDNNLGTDTRIYNGGIYSWYSRETQSNLKQQLRVRSLNRVHKWGQPTRYHRIFDRIVAFVQLRPGSTTLALTIVVLCLLTAMLISWLVPPIGFDSRCIGEISITATWIIIAACDYVPFRKKYAFAFMVAKDFTAALGTTLGIILTQVGVLNRVDSYTQWGRTGFALPEAQSVADVLNHGIRSTYPAIAFSCIAIQLLVFPGIVFLQYSNAVRVFLQRDDGKSNLSMYHRCCGYFASKLHLGSGANPVPKQPKRMTEQSSRHSDSVAINWADIPLQDLFSHQDVYAGHIV